MTKEEKIKEAWAGFYNPQVKDSGWMDINAKTYSNDKFFDRLQFNDKRHSIRPKTLQGIENNNGWIKIYSEEDLPKYPWTKYDTCWSRRIDGFISVILIKDLTHDNHSHWMETKTPQQPIY